VPSETQEMQFRGCDELFSILNLDKGMHEYTQAKYCSLECEPCAGSEEQKLCSRDHCQNGAFPEFEVGDKTFCNALCAKAYRLMILRQGNPETAPDGVCARDFCGKQAIVAFRQGGRPYCCILRRVMLPGQELTKLGVWSCTTRGSHRREWFLGDSGT
jgi:hypothetical protein